jgi:U2-associated protein SR140
MTEEKIAHVFGSYGPLASVKIMWPRGAGAREPGRTKLCGFVAFMLRNDAEKALEELTGKVIEDAELKIGWGKAVAIPPRPYFVMPTTMAAISTGLPFNATPARPGYGAVAPLSAGYGDPDDVLRNASISVSHVELLIEVPCS